MWESSMMRLPRREALRCAALGIAVTVLSSACGRPADGAAGEADVGLLLVPAQEDDAGSIDEGTLIDRTFVWRNNLDHAVRPVDVRRSCGCTRVEYSSEAVPPGGALSMTVHVDTRGRRGTLEAIATLIDESGRDLAVAAVRANVQQPVGAWFDIPRMTVPEGTLDLGGLLAGHLVVEWRSDQLPEDLTSRRIQATSEDVQLEIQAPVSSSDERGLRHEYPLRLLPSARLQNKGVPVAFEVDVSGIRARCLVDVQPAPGALVLSPSELFFGGLARGEVAHRAVDLQGCVASEVAWDCACTQLQVVERETDDGFVVTLAAGPAVGLFHEAIVFTRKDGVGGPVEVPVTAVVR